MNSNVKLIWFLFLCNRCFKIESVENYYCGIKQGNFYYYSNDGKILDFDFYDGNRKIISQSYNENQTLNEIEYFDKKWVKNSMH